jgi:hypothetical protein
MKRETSSMGVPRSISHWPAAWRKSLAEALSTFAASQAAPSARL